MAQSFEELSAVLVQDSYGALNERIFSTIAGTGRLSRHQLRVKLRIPRRQLREALLGLVQQHILLYDRSGGNVVFYQVNWRSAYAIARAARIFHTVKDRYGLGAGEIVTELQRLGHASVEALAQALGLAPSIEPDDESEACKEHENGDETTNGTQSKHVEETGPAGSIKTISRLHATLRMLLRSGFLVKVTKRAYTPAADLQGEIEQIVIDERFPDGKVTGPKKQVEFRHAVNTLKRKWQVADDYSENRDVESRGVTKRPTKRTKLNGAPSNGVRHSSVDGDSDELVPKLPNDLCLRVNFAQCAMSFRSQLLRQLSAKFLGDTTASVYGALLRVLEGKIRVRDQEIPVEEDMDEDEDDLPFATTTEVLEFLDRRIDLSDSINGAAELYKRSGDEKKSKGKAKVGYIDQDHEDLGIKTELASDSDNDPSANGILSLSDRNRRQALVEEHLNLLKEHSKGFCERKGGGGGAHGSWRVDFSAVVGTLVTDHIDRTVLDTLGQMYVRVLRLLREKGKLDERQIIALCMMQTKDVRTILTQLQFAGILEVQEVPRDATRQPGRTIFLWYHDPKRYQNALLHQTYQGMARTLQRLKAERENHKNVIEKANMSDTNVQSLSRHERDAVMQWREVEEKLLVQLHRLDDDVALLRDFSGKDTSLVS